MARIRSIKPEFWSSDQILDISPIARLTFIGLWNFCDDSGRHKASCRQLKAEVFPADAITEQGVHELVDELISNKLLLEYQVDGVRLWQVTGWHHQKIDRPKPSKYPGPDADDSKLLPRQFYEQSSKDRRSVDESSSLIGRDRIGSEGIGSVDRSNQGRFDPVSDPKVIHKQNRAERFAEWWATYPKKVKKRDSLKVWKSRQLDGRADELIADVKRRVAEDGKWRDGFVPDPPTYLRGERWEDEIAEPRRLQNGNGTLSWGKLKAMSNAQVLELADRYGVSTRGKYESQLYGDILAAAGVKS